VIQGKQWVGRRLKVSAMTQGISCTFDVCRFECKLCICICIYMYTYICISLSLSFSLSPWVGGSLMVSAMTQGDSRIFDVYRFELISNYTYISRIFDVYRFECISNYTCIYVYVCIHMYAPNHTYIYVYICIHIYAPPCLSLSPSSVGGGVDLRCLR